MIKKRENWEPIEVRIEGGFINYGLLPLEVGLIFGLNRSKLLSVIICQLNGKNTIELKGKSALELNESVIDVLRDNSLNELSKRIAISKEIKSLINEYEYMVLHAIFPNKSLKIKEIGISILYEYLEKSLENKMAGYSETETKTYYSNLMEFVVNQRGWSNETKEKDDWVLVKKALDLGPTLEVVDMVERFLR